MTRRLEVVLDDKLEIEPVKAEVLRELEETACDSSNRFCAPIQGEMKMERTMTRLVALAFRWKESFILAVVYFLKLETTYDVGRDSRHGGGSNAHACGTKGHNVLTRGDSVIRRQPSAQIPKSLIKREPEGVAFIRPHGSLLGGEEQLARTAALRRQPDCGQSLCQSDAGIGLHVATNLPMHVEGIPC